MTVEKPKLKQLLRPITTGADSAMNQSEFLAITGNSLEAREKSRVPGAIGFGFASHWLKNWRDSFKPIAKRSNRSHEITFDNHLKTALMDCTVFTVTNFTLPCYFETPLFRTFFNFPLDFEIAGFDCISNLVYCQRKKLTFWVIAFRTSFALIKGQCLKCQLCILLAVII